MIQQYYIVSIKHTSKGDTALTFWGKNGSGYTYHRGGAGLYTSEQLHGRISKENVAVEKEKIDPFWMNAIDFEDKFIAVPNNAIVLNALGLTDKYMKPKKWKSCKMVFLNTPVPIDEQELKRSVATKSNRITER